MDTEIAALHPGWQALFAQSNFRIPLSHAWQNASNDEQQHRLLPAAHQRLEAFRHTHPDDVKVLILGQDPYPQAENAMGLSFSVSKSQHKLPGSLKNIRKEILREYPENSLPEHGNLISWVKQGVLLLNTVLTVREGDAGSHLKHIGWEAFTRVVIDYLSSEHPGMAVLAWGKHAHKLTCDFGAQHCVIKTSHPSGLGHFRSGKDFDAFTGSDCFIRANSYLTSRGLNTIDWCC